MRARAHARTHARAHARAPALMHTIAHQLLAQEHINLSFVPDDLEREVYFDTTCDVMTNVR